LLITCKLFSDSRPYICSTAIKEYLLNTGTSDGRWALPVLDAAVVGAASLDCSDNLVGFDIAVGNATEDDVLAVKP
jgi:hypothetical protein